jgi:hypothetical protein
MKRLVVVVGPRVFAATSGPGAVRPFLSPVTEASPRLLLVREQRSEVGAIR